MWICLLGFLWVEVVVRDVVCSLYLFACYFLSVVVITVTNPAPRETALTLVWDQHSFTMNSNSMQVLSNWYTELFRWDNTSTAWNHLCLQMPHLHIAWHWSDGHQHVIWLKTVIFNTQENKLNVTVLLNLWTLNSQTVHYLNCFAFRQSDRWEASFFGKRQFSRGDKIPSSDVHAWNPASIPDTQGCW